MDGRQNDVSSSNRCELEAAVTRDDCDDDNCELAVDDAGCQYCLCDDRDRVAPEPETRAADDGTTTTDGVATTTTTTDGDDATTTIAADLCDSRFVCHPICQSVVDGRGCVVECRCDDVISSLHGDIEQQEQQPHVFVADYDSPAVTCAETADDSVCSCDADVEEELWTVGEDDGCPTCTCVTRPTPTTDDLTRSTSDHIVTTTTATTTAAPSTSPGTDTTTTKKIITTTTATSHASKQLGTNRLYLT